MLENVASAITGIISAIGDILSPTASESTGLTQGAVAAIAALFAVPIIGGISKKVVGLVKSMRG